jgi:hypothetical protein
MGKLPISRPHLDQSMPPVVRWFGAPLGALRQMILADQDAGPVRVMVGPSPLARMQSKVRLDTRAHWVASLLVKSAWSIASSKWVGR